MTPVPFLLRTALAVFLILLTDRLSAQAGSHDPTFNVADTLEVNGKSGVSSGSVYALLAQPDNKIVLSGKFTSCLGVPRNKIARRNADGSLDMGFDPGVGVGDGIITDMLLQPDGRIIIVGAFDSCGGVPRNGIARLHPDGSLDTSFDPGTGISIVPAVPFTLFDPTAALQPDGKILLGGEDVTIYDGTPQPGITRINPDGSRDTTFDAGSGPDEGIKALALQSDGKILVGGFFSTFDSIARRSLVRLHTDGRVDTTFDAGQGEYNWTQSVLLQPDQKIIVEGNFTTAQGGGASIIRLHPEGSQDTTFQPFDGTSYNVRTIAALPDGRIILGSSPSYNGVKLLTVLHTDGGIDNSFRCMIGNVYDDEDNSAYVSALAVTPSGDIAAAGEFEYYGLRVWYDDVSLYTTVRLSGYILVKPNGERRHSRGVEPGGISTMMTQADGKMMFGGRFFSYNGSPQRFVLRFHPDGSRDSTLTNPFEPLGNEDYDALIHMENLPDGKYLGVTLHEDYDSDGYYYYSTRRFLPDWAFDPTYVSHYILSRIRFDTLYVSKQSDQKLIISGKFYQVSSLFEATPRAGIARFNADGSLDTGYNPGANINGITRAWVWADDRVLIKGSFSQAYGVSRPGLALLQGDGSLDYTFNPGTGFGDSLNYQILPYAQDQLLAWGDFTSYDGVPCGNFIRINIDGSRDLGFAAPDINGPFNLAPLSDGRFMAQGDFTTVNGVPRPGVAMLNADLTLNTVFDPATGFNGSAPHWLLLPDGKLLAAGNFTRYNGAIRHQIVRILADGTTAIEADDLPATGLTLSPNPNTGRFTLRSARPLVQASARLLTLTGQEVSTRAGLSGTEWTLDYPGLPAGIYLLEVREADRAEWVRVVIE
ncbi:MAG: hypothetical protein SF053_04545 [Bacteroidia bacterium]|nr:hypothetical protein [Bacteroidia bacterium]